MWWEIKPNKQTRQTFLPAPSNDPASPSRTHQQRCHTCAARNVFDIWQCLTIVETKFKFQITRSAHLPVGLLGLWLCVRTWCTKRWHRLSVSLLCMPIPLFSEMHVKWYSDTEPAKNSSERMQIWSKTRLKTCLFDKNIKNKIQRSKSPYHSYQAY